MAFREVSVVQVREALRRWLKGDGERPIAQGSALIARPLVVTSPRRSSSASIVVVARSSSPTS